MITEPIEELEDIEDERVYALGSQLELAQTIVGQAFAEVQTRIYEEEEKFPRNEEYLERLDNEARRLWTLKSTFRISNMIQIQDALTFYSSYILPQP